MLITIGLYFLISCVFARGWVERVEESRLSNGGPKHPATEQTRPFLTSS